MTHSPRPPAVPPYPRTNSESRSIDIARVTASVRQLLLALGENPDQQRLAQTPQRVAAWYHDFLSPSAADPATCFPERHVSGQLVTVGGMTLWSLCEHHLLPMHLQVTVGYLPEAKVVGLSKIGRIAQHFAGRLQVQERFTRQVGDAIADALDSDDVAVAVRGAHLCMSMRGVRMETARTTTLEHRGRFDKDPALVQSFLTLASSQWRPE